MLIKLCIYFYVDSAFAGRCSLVSEELPDGGRWNESDMFLELHNTM